MKNIFQRGFTLIELLVVIAIIGILAAVVIGSLNDARSGGQNASIQQTMASLRSQAEIYYNGPGNYSYTGLCADAQVDSAVTAALAVINGPAYDESTDTDTVATNSLTDEDDRKAMCNANASGYQVTAPLSGGEFWCVDSSGSTSQITTSPTTGETTCS